MCINDGLSLGSMLPQAVWAQQNGYPCLVMNPNESTASNGKKIKYSGTMAKHAVHIWKNYIENSGFEKVLVIAHSAGGGCVTALMSQFSETFFQQVSQIAYTDSWVVPQEQLSAA